MNADSSPSVSPRIYGRWIYFAGITLLCVVVLAGNFPGDGKWVRVLHDSGHGYVFAVVGVLCLLAWRRIRPSRGTRFVAYIGAWIVATSIGLATEIAQMFVARDASWSDVRMDAIGAAFGLALLFAWERRRSRGRGAFVAALLVLALAATMLQPTAGMVFAYWQRNAAFPVLAQFDRFYGRYFVRPEHVEIDVADVPDRWTSNEARALRVDFRTGTWSMVSFIDFVPDWSSYSTLVLEVVNPNAETTRVHFRAHDADHNQFFQDRFNTYFDLAPQARQEIRIPLADVKHGGRTRQLDLTRMKHFGLFRGERHEPTTIYVVGARLEK